MQKMDDFDPNICQKMNEKREMSFFFDPKFCHLTKKSKNLLSLERKQVSRKNFFEFQLKKRIPLPTGMKKGSSKRLVGC